MDLTAVLSIAILVGLVVGLAAFVLVSQKQQAQQKPQEQAVEEDSQQAAGRRANRLRGRELRQRRNQQQQAAAAAAAGAESDSDDDEDEVPLNRREQRRAERADAREAEAAARTAKLEKINAYEEKRKKKEADREAREKAQEEEIRRAAEEKQRAEDEEAAKWMSMISVEQTGEVSEEASAEDSGLLGRFVDYIQMRKMIPIEEAAVEFGLRSSDVVDRIQGLESMGRLTGVMDERGKFIYISRQEMEAVAAYIRRKGRVSIAQLAAQSNDLIDLEAKSAPAGLTAGGPAPAIDFDAVLGAAEPVAVA